MSRLRRVWDELRRRHVVRVGITYVAVAVAIAGAADAFRALEEISPAMFV